MQVDASELRKAERLAQAIADQVPGSKVIAVDQGLSIGVMLGTESVWSCRRLMGDRDAAHGWFRADESRLEALVNELKGEADAE